MEITLFVFERKATSFLWHDGNILSRDIAKLRINELGRKVIATYAWIRRCMKKGAINDLAHISSIVRLCHKRICRRRKQTSGSTRDMTALLASGSWLCRGIKSRAPSKWKSQGILSAIWSEVIK